MIYSIGTSHLFKSFICEVQLEIVNSIVAVMIV